jgi:cyclic 2,3-diphosphoglycerate synthetase
VAIADLEPVPLAEVRDKDVFFATTANAAASVRLAERLEATAGCRVVTVSSRLADRDGLAADLASSPPFDVLLTELKAAAVDVAARDAVARGAQVVFVDNRPVSAGGDAEVDEVLRYAASLALERGAERLEARR